MATFPLPFVGFFFKINRRQAIHDMDKLCKFHKNVTTNADFNVYTKNANCQFKMATFPLVIVWFIFKIDKVQSIDESNKLCKFHENLTKNVDFIALTRKTNKWTDRRTMETKPWIKPCWLSASRAINSMRKWGNNKRVRGQVITYSFTIYRNLSQCLSQVWRGWGRWLPLYGPTFDMPVIRAIFIYTEKTKLQIITWQIQDLWL